MMSRRMVMLKSNSYEVMNDATLAACLQVSHLLDISAFGRSMQNQSYIIFTLCKASRSVYYFS